MDSIKWILSSGLNHQANLIKLILSKSNYSSYYSRFSYCSIAAFIVVTFNKTFVAVRANGFTMAIKTIVNLIVIKGSLILLLKFYGVVDVITVTAIIAVVAFIAIVAIKTIIIIIFSSSIIQVLLYRFIRWYLFSLV